MVNVGDNCDITKFFNTGRIAHLRILYDGANLKAAHYTHVGVTGIWLMLVIERKSGEKTIDKTRDTYILKIYTLTFRRFRGDL